MMNNILQHLDFLIQQDTQNPPRKICKDDELYKHLTKHFRDNGFMVELTDLGNGHVIFYAKKGHPDVLFNVHIDTVPVTNSTMDSWQHDPFKLTVTDKKAYGRGSCDIKGAAACLMELAKTSQNLAVVFTSDEEGANGCCVQTFIDSNDLSQYTQVIIAEPTNSQAVVCHRGYLSVSVEFYGENGHSSVPTALESNAIHKSGKWLGKALDYAQSFVSNNNPSGICFNVGVIKGGEKNNMIAETLHLDFSTRVPSGTSSQKIYQQLKAFDTNSSYEAKMMAPPLPADKQNNNAALAFSDKHNIEIAKGVDFWTEAALFSQAGFSALVIGPGDIKQAHTIDEWVYLSQLEKTYNIYAQVINHEE